MRILEQAFDVISQPPGDLVYFLVALFALQQAFVSALTAFRNDRRRRDRRHTLARRWLWASGGMLLARAALVILGLLSVAALISPGVVLPALERWVLVAQVFGLIWAGMLDERSRTWRTPALLAGLVVSLLLAAVGPIVRSIPALPVPGWDMRLVGLGGLLLVLLLAFVTAILLRPREWEWGLGVVFFWVVGTVIQLVWGPAATPVDGWLRLTSLAALPLLSIWVHRQLWAGECVPSSDLAATTTLSAKGGVKAVLAAARPLFEALQVVRAARDLDSSLILASSKLTTLLDVDVCAIALSDRDEKELEVARVVAVAPPTSAQISPPVLPLVNYAGLALAIEQRQVVAATPREDALWLAPLFDALGFDTPLPLAVLPLHHHDRDLGLLLLGGPRDANAWSVSEMPALVFVAEQLSSAIATAQRTHGQPVEDVAPATPPDGVDAERAAMAQALEKAKVQFKALNGRIRTLLQEIKARDEEIVSLNQELESRRHGASESELSVWQNEIRQLVDERESFERQIQDLTEDRDILLSERSRLGEALDEAKEQLDQVEAHRERLEEEVARLTSRIEERDAQVSALQTQVAASDGSETAYEDVREGAVGILIADEDGKIKSADPLARQMLRLPEGDVVGAPIDGAYADPRWSQAIDDLLAPSDAGGLDRLHLTLTLPDGQTEADLACLRGRDGEADGLVITLRSSQSDAERYEALLSLASDFRTPMTAITGYADLLLGEQAGILTEMQQQFLQRVKANIEQLNVLINDLIRVTSPDTRPIELSPQPVNLIEIIEEAIMGLAARFRERKLTVQLDLPPEIALVEADRDSLYQIMLRLLSNAVACSEVGSQVVVGAEERTFDGDGKHLQISVVDTGGGIAPEDYPRVFRHFYRANQPLVEGMGETSVGMAMAKTLVEANGGRIWVESEEGIGSTLSFVLPCEAESPA